jgi:fatty-acyl-CoA synthase
MGDLFPGPVLAVLRSSPWRPAIEAGSRRVSRGELLSMVHRLAGGLRAAGLGPGRGVGMLLDLTPEAYAAHLAAHLVGCRVAAARPGWSQPQLASALSGRVDALVTDRPGPLGPGVPAALRLADLMTAGPDRAGPDRAGPDRGPDRAGPDGAGPDDVARLTFTSGSTGQPKACAHTYAAMSLAYRPADWPPVLADLLTRFDRCLVLQNLAGPVMFTYLGRCLVAGGTAVLAPDQDPATAIERHRITATMMPPARLDAAVRSGADLRTLRAVVIGGSPAGPQVLRSAADRLGPALWQGYGQAEAGVIAMLTPDDIAAGHVTSVGRPLPAVEIAVRSDGEIHVRSPHMMTGYWGDPEQTEQVLRDGWLATRDLGHLDADGLLHLTGRARDVIMVNAEVCYAGAVETVLVRHPGVAQAFVVGVPDERTGEAVHAFVVPADGRVPESEELRALVRAELSANSVPARIHVIDDVPMSVGGKPDKIALRDRTTDMRGA